MKILLVSYASHFIEPVKAMQREAQEKGWDISIGGGDESWQGFKQKLAYVITNIDKWKQDYDYIVFLDAYDVRILGYQTELNNVLKAYDYPQFLGSVEINCWPKPSNAELHPKPPIDVPWKHFHSLYCMRTDSISLFNEPIDNITSDQLYVQEMLLKNKHLPIDYKCEVFQQLCCLEDVDKWFEVNNKRVINKLTKAMPIFLHANGTYQFNRIKGI